jgi:sugar phosphate isomerase/epimerase
MSRIYSMAYLTSAPLPAPECISLAAKLGYHAVGIRILPAAPGGDVQDLIADKAALRETVARMQATGVSVFDVEIIRINEHFALENYKAFLEVCGALSAKAILVGGDDRNEARLTENYARFCAAAAPYGLTADLEFMPWSGCRDAQAAARIASASGQANAGVLVDTLHCARSSTTLDDIAAIPRELLHYAQVCDAPGAMPVTFEELIYTARTHRLLPGEGTIRIRDVFDRLPATIPVSVEVPSIALKAEIGVKEFARRALEASRKVLEGTA